MILWGQLGSPFVRRVAVALHHHGVAFDSHPLPLDASPVNPLGRAPALTLDSGEVLTDSRAILEWLEACAPPDLRLTPEEPGALKAVLALEAVALATTVLAQDLTGEKLRREVPDIAQIGRLEKRIAAGLDWLEPRAEGRPLFGALSRADLALGCLSTYIAEQHPRLYGARRRIIAHRAWAERLPAFVAAPARAERRDIHTTREETP